MYLSEAKYKGGRLTKMSRATQAKITATGGPVAGKASQTTKMSRATQAKITATGGPVAGKASQTAKLQRKSISPLYNKPADVRMGFGKKGRQVQPAVFTSQPAVFTSHAKPRASTPFEFTTMPVDAPYIHSGTFRENVGTAVPATAPNPAQVFRTAGTQAPPQMSPRQMREADTQETDMQDGQQPSTEALPVQGKLPIGAILAAGAGLFLLLKTG